MAIVDSSVVCNGKSNDLNHSGYSMEATDFGSKGMADDCKE